MVGLEIGMKKYMNIKGNVQDMTREWMIKRGWGAEESCRKRPTLG